MSHGVTQPSTEVAQPIAWKVKCAIRNCGIETLVVVVGRTLEMRQRCDHAVSASRDGDKVVVRYVD